MQFQMLFHLPLSNLPTDHYLFSHIKNCLIFGVISQQLREL